MSKDYDDTDDFSVYERDLEEDVEASRRSRRKAKSKRKGVKYEADLADEETPVKASESFEDKYKEDLDDEDKTQPIAEKSERVVEEPSEPTAETETKDADMKKGKKNKKPKSLKRKFFTILFSILGAYVLLVMVFLGITYLDGESTEIPANPTEMIKKVAQKTQEVVVGKVPDRTTVLMFVIDKEYDDVTGEYLYPRTDSIVLANYDNVNKRLSMMSIPRDTIVEVSDDMYNKLCAEFPEPGKKQMKINAIYHYAGEKHGMEYLKEEITRIFGVDPDYCVCVNFEGFNYIVDSIGGVEFDVPIDMVYDDPAQDLHINLKAGKQVLDGDKAQQFVRYRKDNYGNGYAGGDIERIAVQQAFLKALMNKALSSETVFKNIFAYFNAFNKYVKTDASINDMARYATVLKSINMNDVITETLPGEPAYIYGISGYRVNESEAAALVYNTFVKPLNEIKKELGSQQSEEGIEKSTDKRIKVLNGGYTEGLAGEIQNRFAEKGISVLSIGTYNGEKTSETRIYVSKEGEGLDLVKCFDKTATVITDSTKTAEEECDILVIVGTEEPLVRQNVSQTTPSGSVPLTLNIISSGGQDTDVQQPAVDSGRDYTDYDFDDEDDEDGEEYSYDDTEEEEEDTDNQSYDDEEEEEEEEDYSGSDDEDEDEDVEYTENEDDSSEYDGEDEQYEESDDGSEYDVYEEEVEED